MPPILSSLLPHTAVSTLSWFFFHTFPRPPPKSACGPSIIRPLSNNSVTSTTFTNARQGMAWISVGLSSVRLNYGRVVLRLSGPHLIAAHGTNHVPEGSFKRLQQPRAQLQNTSRNGLLSGRERREQEMKSPDLESTYACRWRTEPTARVSGSRKNAKTPEQGFSARRDG